MIRDGLDRYDLLGRQDDGPPRNGVSADRCSAAPQIFYDQATDDEVTGDVTGSRRSFLSRLDGRSRSILTSAAAAAVLVNAGAVWAYWHITDSTTGRANAGTVFELNLRGRSDLNKPLTPGSTGDLIVTVTNVNNFPIRITSVSPGTEKVVADVEHRDNGCVDPGVTVARPKVKVGWDVTRNNVAAFTVPGGLRMAASADAACKGAVFTVPVMVSATTGVS